MASFKGNIKEAKEYYQQYLNKKKNGRFAEASGYYLVLQKLKDKDSDVLPMMRSHMSLYADSSYGNHMQYQLVKYFRDREDFSAACLEAKKLLEKYPACSYAIDMQYQLGEFYYRAGRKDEAKKHFRKIIKDNNPNTEPSAIGQYLLAELYDREGKSDSAKAEYLKVKENNPGVSNWAILGEYSDAMCYYNEWAMLSDSIKMDSIKLKTPVGKLQSFTVKYPNDKRTPRAMMTLAGIYDRAGEYEKALGEFDRIIGFDASQMSNISEQTKDMELKAHRDLVESARMSKALTLRESLKRLQDALKEYETVLSLNAQNYEAKLGKAMTLIRLDRKAEAAALLQELVSNETQLKVIAQSLLNSMEE